MHRAKHFTFNFKKLIFLKIRAFIYCQTSVDVCLKTVLEPHNTLFNNRLHVQVFTLDTKYFILNWSFRFLRVDSPPFSTLFRCWLFANIRLKILTKNASNKVPTLFKIVFVKGLLLFIIRYPITPSTWKSSIGKNKINNKRHCKT